MGGHNSKVGIFTRKPTVSANDYTIGLEWMQASQPWIANNPVPQTPQVVLQLEDSEGISYNKLLVPRP